ncbi:MAG: ATP-dependent zinc metalloprotease FtsH [Myxococcota bacterium]
MPQWAKWIVFVALGAAVLGALYWSGARPGAAPRAEVPYTRFIELVREDRVSEVVLRGHAVDGQLRNELALGADEVKTDRFHTRVPDFGESGLMEALEDRGVTVRVEPEREGTEWSWLLWLLPLLLLFVFWGLAARRVREQMGAGGAGGMMGLSQIHAKRVAPKATKARFEDVAGQDGAKRDVAEIVEYLKDPDRYHALGAEVPHGVLLVGPPGTGKTLMARALAGEAEVPFFHMSGSEFIEMVVGVGAARVRRTFEEAKKHQPSILFIDEIDAIGRQRGTGMGGGHDEREQTLNQILDEMDGFEERSSVVVVAATNRPDVLDPALLRPGRFDRRLTLELPERDARKRILELHARNVPIADDVDLDVLARWTPGFSGAHLKNLINEAAMLAAREHSSAVTRRHIDEAHDKVMMGPGRPLSVGAEERRRLAVHEGGHAAAAHYLERTDPPFRVTIMPRGQALGGTHTLPEEERHTMDESRLRARLSVMLAGRVCERLMLGSVSSGADDDIRKASQLARSMVTRWGMSEEVGPVDLRDGDENPFLGYEMTHRRPYSDATAHAVDQEVRRLLLEAEERTKRLLEAHRDRIARLIDRLDAEETLDRPAIEHCLGRRGASEAA